MYKKIILATAIAAVSAPALSATWTADGLGKFALFSQHTKEGAKNYTAAAGVPAGNAAIKLNAGYAQNDLVTFTYNYTKNTDYAFPTSFRSFATGGATEADLQIKGATAASDTCILLSTVGNTVNEANLVAGDTFAITSTVAGITGVTYTIMDVSPTAAEGFGVGVGSTICNNSAGEIGVSPTITAIAADNSAIVIGSRAIKTIDFDYSSSTNNSVTYRVSAVEATGAAKNTTIGAQIYAPAMDALPSSISAVGVGTVSFSAESQSGVAMDATTGSATIIKAVQQYTNTVTTKLDAIINVEADRKAFKFKADNTTAGTATSSTDTLILTHAALGKIDGKEGALSALGAVTSSAVTGLVATTDTTTTLINGDFAFADNAVAAGITSTTLAATNQTSAALNAAGTVITVVDATTATNTITLTKDQAAAVIPVQTFTGTSTIAYTSNGTAATDVKTWTDLGSWTLNGAAITAYGVPMGPAVSRFLWVSNKGATDAAFNYTIVMNGSSYGPYPLATVAAKSSKSLGGLIDTDLGLRGVYVAPSSRANIILDAPVKDADVTVSASYKHIGDSDRLGLETSDTVDATSK